MVLLMLFLLQQSSNLRGICATSVAKPSLVHLHLLLHVLLLVV